MTSNSPNFLNEVFDSDLVSIDIETTGLHRYAQIVTIAVGYLSEEGIIKTSFYNLDSICPDKKTELEQVLLGTIFNNEFSGEVIFHNMAFDLKHILLRFGTLIGIRDRENFRGDQFCEVTDTLALSRLQNSTKMISHADPKGSKCHSLKYLAKEFAYSEDKDAKDFGEVTGGINIRFVNSEDLAKYNRQDVVKTIYIYQHLRSVLNDEEWNYWRSIERHHIWNIFHLVWHGVSIDRSKLFELADAMRASLEDLSIEIFKLAGREFNIESPQQLGKALFNNPKVTYSRGDGRPPMRLSPFGFGDSGEPSVDLETIKAVKKRIERVDPISNFLPLARRLSRYLEISNNLNKLEILEDFLMEQNGVCWVDPNISASTKSGRISCSGPNLLGLSKKIFKKGGLSVESDEFDNSLNNLWEAFKNRSVRETITIPKGMIIARIDISGLDLGILTWGGKQFNDTFFWTKLFKKYNTKIPDPHFSILQEIARVAGGKARNLFNKAFLQFEKDLEGGLDNYYPMKHDDIGIEFIHRTALTSKFVLFTNAETKDLLDYVREFTKKVVLASAYLIGGRSLAVGLADALGEHVLQEESQAVLDAFYKAFPEIRLFQDKIGQEVYDFGYAVSPFGRTFYADTWGDINKGLRLNSNATMSFICEYNYKWFYIETSEYIRQSERIIENLKLTDGPFGLKFKEVLTVRELDRDIFKLRQKSKDLTSFRKGSEELNHEFELSRIAITERVQRSLSRPHTMTGSEWNLKYALLLDGNYFLSEKYIRFFKIDLGDPASKYFKKYQPLLKSIKSFFPMYCQGIANSVAVTCLTHVRQRIEKEIPDSKILFFIHDEIVLLIPNNEEAKSLARDILNESVENMDLKRPFDVPFTGKFKILDQFE